MSDATLFAVAITATEWRSLFLLGEIRLARRRVQELHLPINNKERDRLFAWAPTTVLGDDNDTIVIEIVTNWLEETKRHSAHPSELVVITLAQVFSHHAVSAKSHSYLSGDAAQEGVDLSSGRFEDLWLEWVRQQEAAVDLAAAQTLIGALGIKVDLTRKRTDGYAWHDIVRLARNSKTSVKTKSRHIEDLLRSVRRISDSVAGLHASAAFTLAANIEWINVRLGKDPLVKKALRDKLEAALETGRTVNWSVDTKAFPPLAAALALLEEKFPRAYTAEVSPDVVAFATRLVMASKDQSLAPINFVSAIKMLVDNGSRESAATIGVAVSGALGPTMSRRLTRALATINPSVLNWS